MTMTLTVISQTQRGLLLVTGLRLAVDKVIHHNNVVLPIIIRPRGDVASCDPDPRDGGILKHDAEERKVRIARRGRNEAAEQKFAARVEVLHQRTGPSVSLLLPRPAPVRLVNVGEHRAKATDRCWDLRIRTGLQIGIGAGYEEQSFGDVAPYRGEQARSAEHAKGGAVGRIVKEHLKATLGPI